MWEDLKIYKQLEKKDINPSFKKLGKEILSALPGYAMAHTSSTIKLSRITKQLEQAVFIEKAPGSYELTVQVCIKPVDFHRKHRFAMVNIVPLGEIMHNYRKTSYPLTREWKELAFYLATRIKNEVEAYFARYDTYGKIIENRKDVEPEGVDFHNKYDLLIYAAIKTRNKELLTYYLEQWLERPVTQVGYSEFMSSDSEAVNEYDFLQRIGKLGEAGDFESIENEIRWISREE